MRLRILPLLPVMASLVAASPETPKQGGPQPSMASRIAKTELGKVAPIDWGARDWQAETRRITPPGALLRLVQQRHGVGVGTRGDGSRFVVWVAPAADGRQQVMVDGRSAGSWSEVRYLAVFGEHVAFHARTASGRFVTVVDGVAGGSEWDEILSITASGDGTRIAYNARRSGSDWLTVVEEVAGRRTGVNAPPAGVRLDAEVAPALSADGRHLAVATTKGRVLLDGRVVPNLERWAGCEWASALMLSPGGERLAVVDKNTSTVCLASNSGVVFSGASFSRVSLRDERLLAWAAFASSPTRERQPRYSVAVATDSGRFNGGMGEMRVEPEWSADHQHVSYVVGTYEGAETLWSDGTLVAVADRVEPLGFDEKGVLSYLARNGQTVRYVTGDSIVEERTLGAACPAETEDLPRPLAVSPDQTRVAYLARAAGASNRRRIVLGPPPFQNGPLSGAALVRATARVAACDVGSLDSVRQLGAEFDGANERADGFAWGPDGRSLAFQMNRSEGSSDERGRSVVVDGERGELHRWVLDGSVRWLDGRSVGYEVLDPPGPGGKAGYLLFRVTHSLPAVTP